MPSPLSNYWLVFMPALIGVFLVRVPAGTNVFVFYGVSSSIALLITGVVWLAFNKPNWAVYTGVLFVAILVGACFYMVSGIPPYRPV